MVLCGWNVIQRYHQNMISDPETRAKWLERYQGKSKDQAQYALNSFDKFITTEWSGNEQEFLHQCQRSDWERYNLLDQMVQFWANEKLWSTTIRNYFSFIRSYLKRYGIMTDNEGVKDNVKFPKNIIESRSPLTMEIIEEIISASNKKYIALFLCLVSTGMRIGEMLAAQVNWLEYSLQKKYGLVLIKIPAIHTKGKVDRFSFLNEQAYLALKPYLATKLSKTNRLFEMNYDSAKTYMETIRERLGLDEKYATGFSKINIHSFRSFTETVLSDHSNAEFAHFILGHKGYLKYYRKSPEQAAVLYNEAKEYLMLPKPEVTNSMT